MRPSVVIPWLTAGTLAVGQVTALLETLDALDSRDAVDASKLAILDELVSCRVELREERAQ